MKLMTVFAALAGLLVLPVASAAPNLRPTTDTLQRVARPRATGSGPLGLVTVDDSNTSSSRPETVSEVTSVCRKPTKATPEDCAAAIGDLRGYPGDVTVAANLCYNWWKDSCLVKVCAMKDPYTGRAAAIADTVTSTLLNPCVKGQKKSGVDSDCSDVDSKCGTYRYWLTDYNGEYD